MQARIAISERATAPFERWAARLADGGESLGTLKRWKNHAVAIVVSGLCFGAVLGSFNAGQTDWVLASVYSAIKTPLLVIGATLICLPGYFVLSSVLKLREDFGAAFGAITAGQAGQSVALASLAPVLLFAYRCGIDHRLAVVLAGVLFGVATGIGFEVMRRRYVPLLKKRAAHRVMLAAWLVMYVFTGIQGGWMLRPFVGTPGMRVTFVRDEPMSNAYVVVWRLVGSQVGWRGGGE